MKKHLLNLRLVANERIGGHYALLRLTADRPLPEMLPGQFVNIRVADSPATFLRRPISIHRVDKAHNELWLLVAAVGPGTRRLAALTPGAAVDTLLPLGGGFTIKPGRTLLVGGGVGVAPLLYAGEAIKAIGGEPTFLLGARSKADLLETERFREVGPVLVTTEDATEGERGFVTDHSVWGQQPFDRILVCGPSPMMKAVAAKARETQTPCEVSLENMMACGLGACLCCVEDTTDGNVCVCKEGPVFNTERLKW